MVSFANMMKLDEYVRERGGSGHVNRNYSDIWIPGADMPLEMAVLDLNE